MRALAPRWVLRGGWVGRVGEMDEWLNELSE